jgi:hypothetical protein
MPRWPLITPRASTTLSPTDWMERACRRVTLERGPWLTTRTSWSKLRCTRPWKFGARQRNGRATSETAMPCGGSVRGSSPADRLSTPFGTGCRLRSSSFTRRRFVRPSPKGSPPRLRSARQHDGSSLRFAASSGQAGQAQAARTSSSSDPRNSMWP